MNRLETCPHGTSNDQNEGASGLPEFQKWGGLFVVCEVWKCAINQQKRKLHQDQTVQTTCNATVGINGSIDENGKVLRRIIFILFVTAGNISNWTKPAINRIGWGRTKPLHRDNFRRRPKLNPNWEPEGNPWRKNGKMRLVLSGLGTDRRRFAWRLLTRKVRSIQAIFLFGTRWMLTNWGS